MSNTIKTVAPETIIASSRRFDLIFKIELARAWDSGTPHEIKIAEEAYLEMVRARNGFHESIPRRSGPLHFLEDFRRTAHSIKTQGYDKYAPPIPVDYEGEILDGAHRIAACAAYSKPCRIQTQSRYSGGGSELKAFLAGKMSPAVIAWGMRAYLRRFPNGRLSQDFSGKCKMETPFPDWFSHAHSLRFFSMLWKMRETIFRIKAHLRSGNARIRALKHADDCRHRAIAPYMLAEFLKERNGK